MNSGKTKASAAIVVAAAALGWLGYTAYSLGNRPERIAPSRVPSRDAQAEAGERRMQHTLTAGAGNPAPAAPATPRD